MTLFVSYRDLQQRYTRELCEAGATAEDAAVAVLLAWDIMQTHQACFGVDSTTPVHFSLLPMQRDPHAAASCNGSQSRGDECYVVYVPGQAKNLGYMGYFTDSRVPLNVHLEGIAVHEVRHRVQNREAASIRMFRRTELEGDWPDPQAGLVAAHMYLKFFQDEKTDRAAGVTQENLTWLYCDEEFDAAVVERLYLHRYEKVTNADQMASFVRMPCTRVPFRRP